MSVVRLRKSLPRQPRLTNPQWSIRPESLRLGTAHSVSVGVPKPSTDLPGFKEVVLTGSAGSCHQEETFTSQRWPSDHQGRCYDIAENPFDADKEKLNTDLQPSFGEPGAPVVIVMFSDFQCSYCKEEAKIIRQNVRLPFRPRCVFTSRTSH